MASYVERTENTEESIKKLKAIKERFIKTLRSKLGWKVSVDLDPDYNDLMFDAIFMLSRPATAEESHGEYLKIKYAFMKLGYNDKASFEKYEEARTSTNVSAFPEYLEALDKTLYPYDINDIVATLLHKGYNVEEFYVAKGDKIKLKLNKTMVKDLIDDITLKSSPLFDLSKAARPRAIQPRKRTFINPNPQEYKG